MRNTDRSEHSNRPKRLLMLCQYIYPEHNSTGELVTSLAVGFVQAGFDVIAYSAEPTYYEGRHDVPRKLVYEGVRIERMRNTRFGRSKLVLRAIDGLTYALSTAIRLFLSPSEMTVLAVTSPPFLPSIAAVHRLMRKGRFIVLVQDVYPEAAVQLGTLRAGGLLNRLWSKVDRFTLSQADRIVVVGEDMRAVISRKLPPEKHENIVVIRNWTDGDRVVPIRKASSSTAAQHGLVDPFVVQYSGNVGLSQGLEAVLEAAERLRKEGVVFTFVGQGVAMAGLRAAAAARNLSNVMFLARVPDADLADSLAACDAALVPLSAGMEGLSVPSKYYTAMASGRAALVMMEEHSEIARSVVADESGLLIPAGDISSLCRAVLQLKGDPALLQRLSDNARKAYEDKYTRQRALREYLLLLEGMTTRNPPLATRTDNETRRT